MMVAGLVMSALGGLALGSFSNVVAHRLPRQESLVSPGSHCPGCGAAVRPYDNVPVLSWLLLRGRCRDCATPISVRYPAVEALTAALCVAVVAVGGSAARIALGVVLVIGLVPIALIDYDHRIIPNRILLVLSVVAVAVGTALDPGGEPERLIAGLGAGGFFLAFALAYPRGMGMGDVKLAGVLGLFLGRSVAVAILAAVILGVVVGIVLGARVGAERARRTRVPFGPMLAAGGVLAVLAGPDLVHWYSTQFL